MTNDNETADEMIKRHAEEQERLEKELKTLIQQRVGNQESFNYQTPGGQAEPIASQQRRAEHNLRPVMEAKRAELASRQAEEIKALSETEKGIDMTALHKAASALDSQKNEQPGTTPTKDFNQQAEKKLGFYEDGAPLGPDHQIKR